MRLRRPRFALVLVSILLPVVLLLLVAGGGRSPGRRPAEPIVVGSGPARACQTATARAEVLLHAPVSATARVSQPLSVTETATGGRGTFAVTRGAIVSEQASASRSISLKEIASVRRRACARGPSEQAARGLALRHAYARALAAARAAAPRTAVRKLRGLAKRLQTSELTAARRLATARATSAAAAERPVLVREASAEARKRAG